MLLQLLVEEEERVDGFVEVLALSLSADRDGLLVVLDGFGTHP